ncbi:hypothetical protein B0T18DRAFT_390541 [Schizothecium vesticola]|uniref:Uncharacterized protein n=1 Tax=Schizothecium vesticola TaxID=314040 RepID=A0AA40EV32_9PEZI|nr:hypothetical protein B0T18DRAFT_390541 [Schizothecium vesticola]
MEIRLPPLSLFGTVLAGARLFTISAFSGAQLRALWLTRSGSVRRFLWTTADLGWDPLAVKMRVWRNIAGAGPRSSSTQYKPELLTANAAPTSFHSWHKQVILVAASRPARTARKVMQRLQRTVVKWNHSRLLSSKRGLWLFSCQESATWERLPTRNGIAPTGSHDLWGRAPHLHVHVDLEDITAGRADQGQPSHAVERPPLLDLAHKCQRGRTRPGFSEIWTQTSLHGARGKGPRLGNWHPGTRRRPEKTRRAAVRRARDVGNRDCERRAGGTSQGAILSGRLDLGGCTRRLGGGTTDKVKVSKRSSDQRWCKQEDGILGEITWIFRLNPRATDGRRGYWFQVRNDCADELMSET